MLLATAAVVVTTATVKDDTKDNYPATAIVTKNIIAHRFSSFLIFITSLWQN